MVENILKRKKLPTKPLAFCVLPIIAIVIKNSLLSLGSLMYHTSLFLSSVQNML